MTTRRGAARARAIGALAIGALGTLIGSLLVACAGTTEVQPGPPTTTPPPTTPPLVPSGPAGPLAVGTTYEDARGWIEFQPGDAPLVIIAPHGGTLAPAELADRACAACVTTNDLNTQELARAIADAFARRTGMRPHLVVNRLHRRKFDGNRERPEATGGAVALDPTWQWLQAALDSSAGRVSRRWSRGLVIDLHGHGHAIPRLELGYLLTGTELRRSDATLIAGGDLARTSIARLASDARSGERNVSLLRGANSLGALLAAAGYPAVPSPAMPAPQVGDEYFDGGFNTQRNGSLNGGALDAIQIECHLSGVRDSAAARAQFAEALVTALVTFLDRQYGWRA